MCPVTGNPTLSGNGVPKTREINIGMPQSPEDGREFNKREQVKRGKKTIVGKQLSLLFSPTEIFVGLLQSCGTDDVK